MATLVSALDTVFTPAVGSFTVQVAGKALLQRRNTSGDPWITVSPPVIGPKIFQSVSTGTQFKLTTTDGTTPAVKVDQ